MAIDLNDGIYADEKFRYQLLSRLQSDCEYYLGYGNRYEKHLWSGDVKSHIEDMKVLWGSFPEDGKPEWLTWEQLLEYEEKMLDGLDALEVAKAASRDQVEHGSAAAPEKDRSAR